MMNKRSAILTIVLVCISICISAGNVIVLKSPNEKLELSITNDETKGKLSYSVSDEGTEVVTNSILIMELDNGVTIGNAAHNLKVKKSAKDEKIASPLYKRSEVRNNYNALTLTYPGGKYGIEFRAYDNGVAYRFVTRFKGDIKVIDEDVKLNFSDDNKSYMVPVNSSNKSIEEQKTNSFEGLYKINPLSKQNKEKLSITPFIVELKNGKKLVFTDYNVEDYPGMFILPVQNSDGGMSVEGQFAAYPKTEKQGGHNNLQMRVAERENYIAKTAGERNFPWRLMIVSRNDAEILDSDIPYCLAEESRVKDISWIKPGKVAWDWWNDWNLKGVNFKAGINNDTYKYYIDFASKNGIEYVILDEGWAVNKKADLMQVIPDIDLKMLVDYARQKNVGIILWAGYWAFARDMENVVRHYSEMGVKGFKVDFMDRNDQKIVDFTYKAAELCAQYKMLLDFHGIFPPTGLTRTYPNVLNFEGVAGLEQMKWVKEDYDAVTFETIVPFGRMLVGPMDYTQGAMRNSIKGEYHPIYSNAMSQGTRCRQLAQYVIYESPLNMLCDSPTNYDKEQDCTDYIAKIPVVWDETRIIGAKLGEYVVVARRACNQWYIGGITNWEARDFDIDLSFIKDLSAKNITLYKDGLNADRNAEDYKKEEVKLQNNVIKIHLAPGGGFAILVK